MTEQPATAKVIRVNQDGIKVPWAWVASLIPAAGLAGALGHGVVTQPGADLNAKVEGHQSMILQQHEDMALLKQQVGQILQEMERVRAALERAEIAGRLPARSQP